MLSVRTPWRKASDSSDVSKLANLGKFRITEKH